VTRERVREEKRVTKATSMMVFPQRSSSDLVYRSVTKCSARGA
jgi:hypothetical protein